MDTADGHLWVTSVDEENKKGFLHQFSGDSGKIEREVEIDAGERFHPGGIALDGEYIWIPIAEYRPSSTSVIQRRNRETLSLSFAFDVPDHIGCIAATPEYLIGGNWDAKEFYVWDRNGRLVNKVHSETQNAYQDMKFSGGYLVASGLLPNQTGVIDWLEVPSFRLVRRLAAGQTDRQIPFTQEGMTIRGTELLLLPEDDPSRLFIFDARSVLGGNDQ